jgi:hypothetical protein
MAIGYPKTAFSRENLHINPRLIYTNRLFMGAFSEITARGQEQSGEK